MQIQENLDQALRNQSQYFASASEERLEAGDRLTSIALAMAALPEEGDDRPYVAEAELALSNALGLYDPDGSVVAVGAISPGAIVEDFEVTEDGKVIYVLDKRGLITAWDTDSFQKLAPVDLSGHYFSDLMYAIELAEQDLMQVQAHKAYFTLQKKGTQVTVYRDLADDSWQRLEGEYDLYVSSRLLQGNQLAVKSSTGVYLLDLETKTLRWSAEVEHDWKILAFSEDGGTLWLATGLDGLAAFDTATGQSRHMEIVHDFDQEYGSMEGTGRLCGQTYVYLADTYEHLYLVEMDVTTGQIAYRTFLNEEDAGSWDYLASAQVVAVSDGCAWVWHSSGKLYEIDRGCEAVRIVAEDATVQPVCVWNKERNELAVGVGNELRLMAPGGEAILELDLEERKMVSVCFYGEQLLVLCDDGCLYRYDRTGSLLSKTELSLYDSYYSKISYGSDDPMAVTWDFTEDGELILNAFMAGNLIDCDQWEHRAFVPYMTAYYPAEDGFVCYGDVGLVVYSRYSTAQAVDKAREQLGSFELTQDQKDFYGIG